MSIILKALKNTGSGNEEAKPKDKVEPQADIPVPKPKEEQGFFQPGSSSGGESKSPKFDLKIKHNDLFAQLKTKKVIVLSTALAVAVVFAISMWLWNKSRTEEFRKIPVGVEIVDQKTEDQRLETRDQRLEARDEKQKVRDEQRTTNDNLNDANAAFAAGNYDESIKLFKKAAEQKPDDAFIHNSLGLVYLKKDLYSSAASEFQKSLELNSSCAECYNNFGYLKSLLGESVEARKYLEKSISLAGTYPDPYFNLAVLYEKEADIGTAVKYYRQFLELYPDKESSIYLKVKSRIAELGGD